MFGREIFRKSSLDKMTTPEELDELLQVNSVRTWLLLAAICVVLAGMLLWGFLGVITHEAVGFGIIRIHELPRELVSQYSGQVDSVFCRTGDQVSEGQKLLIIRKLQEQRDVAVAAPFSGEVTGLNVREGSFVDPGVPLLEMAGSHLALDAVPEVIFFVKEQEIPKLRKGMAAFLKLAKAGVPPDFLTGRINFIAGHPASRNAILKYFPDDAQTLQLDEYKFYEVRAVLNLDQNRLAAQARSLIQSLNGLTCQVRVAVARQSPMEFLLH